MTFRIYLIGCVCCSVAVGCGKEVAKSGDRTTPAVAESPAPVSTMKLVSQVVEASCGQCQFGMKDKAGCDLAIRIDGTSYFVDGSGLDDHGDAHGDDGMCNCIRQATVTGEIKDGRFVSASFELMPVDKDKDQIQ